MKRITKIAILFFIVSFTVSCKKEPANQSPVAYAGPDKTIILPVNSVDLIGQGTDKDGSIVNFEWTKVSGPEQYSIVTPTSMNTEVKNLITGSYVFELKVTDNGGLSAKDNVIVNVLTIDPGSNSGAGDWDY